uniref:Uncharacterized protein n=1 Tax=Arundo donax TaxID=35708 RepID=A0A0A9A4J3_ARUDO
MSCFLEEIPSYFSIFGYCSYECINMDDTKQYLRSSLKTKTEKITKSRCLQQENNKIYKTVP